MNRESIPFEALFALQLIGTVVFVIGLSLGGLTTVTLVGGALIMLAIVGLALAASVEATEQPLEDAGGRERSRLPFGLGSK
ncbi:hypothetical protein [Natronorubrum tibetense]|uniref:Uncharacterized protein n=1 Tax=Natronorubrum tibetense GA33 TaxID=1114856 RepID=L9W5I2_9EURY|nr:hypothetical protein [Natronorubrum tibetense]ELY44730.1 hypothetical protein C496_04331 [Natronorubrum tibetense GA33]